MPQMPVEVHVAFAKSLDGSIAKDTEMKYL
jgi:hypothetical protein